MIERVSHMLARANSAVAEFPLTTLYNEGWLLRLVLDWYGRSGTASHQLSFAVGARWFSEGLLASAFLPERRGDPPAESYTHADGVLGHFDILPGKRSEIIVKDGAEQFVVVEAKLGSALSRGVKNAADYDQAARNVACMAAVLGRAGVIPSSVDRLTFYVVAPEARVRAGVFGDLVTKASVERKVRARVARYNRARDGWYDEHFVPLLEHIEIDILTWEGILDAIRGVDRGYGKELLAFYNQCLTYLPGIAG